MKYSFIPPPELVQQWIKECDRPGNPRWQEYEQDVASRAAQWGADQELEACCEIALTDPVCGTKHQRRMLVQHIRERRRPKPPSLKEQALEIVRRTPVNSAGLYSYEHIEIIRRALEQLPDNE
jgi:hypothetical protein